MSINNNASENCSQGTGKRKIGIIVPLCATDEQVVLDCLFMLRGVFRKLDLKRFETDIRTIELTPSKEDINKILKE